MGLFEEGNGSYKLPGGNLHLAFGFREVSCIDVVPGILLYFLDSASSMQVI